MRALTGGSVVLAFAVVLLSWDASRRLAHVSSQQRAPSFEISEGRQVALARETVTLAADEPGTRDAPGPIGAGTPDPAMPWQAGSTARQPPRAREPMSATRRPLDAPRLAVRQFTPGSKEHAEAIQSRIESDDYRGTVAPLARLYFAFFDRGADVEGLNYYTDERDAGVSLEAIADEFAGSEEFGIRYGALDNAAFFDRMFRNVFDVPPDNAQRAYWIAQLDTGMSRGRLMVAFSESGAFQVATANEVFVTMAYAEALGREPDAASFARWVRFLDAGNPRTAVIAGLIGSGRAPR